MPRRPDPPGVIITGIIAAVIVFACWCVSRIADLVDRVP